MVEYYVVLWRTYTRLTLKLGWSGLGAGKPLGGRWPVCNITRRPRQA
jgi:hypothetical protein